MTDKKKTSAQTQKPKIKTFHTIRTSIDNALSPLSILCALTTGAGYAGCFLKRDRFNLLNKYSCFDFQTTCDKFPAVASGKRESFEQLMDKRATELITDSCSLLWSGGVDSTLILSSLVKNGINKDDLEILYTEESMLEFPYLYRWLTKNKYNLIRLPQNDKKQWVKTLSSSMATHVLCQDEGIIKVPSFFWHFDSNDYLYHLPVETFLIEAQRHIPQRMYFPSLTVDQAFEYADIYKTAAEKFGCEIEEACELALFANIILSDVPDYKIIMRHSAIAKKITNFFAGEDFDLFSFQNLSITARSESFQNPEKYKIKHKKYIYEVFPDDNYLLRKGKRPSMAWGNIFNASEHDRDFCIELENGEFIEYQIPNELYDSDEFMSWMLQDYKKGMTSTKTDAKELIEVIRSITKKQNIRHNNDVQQKKTKIVNAF